MKKAKYFYLLRRGFFSGGGLDSDYQAVLDQATTRGFTAPSDTQQNLQSNIIKTLKWYYLFIWELYEEFIMKKFDIRCIIVYNYTIKSLKCQLY